MDPSKIYFFLLVAIGSFVIVVLPGHNHLFCFFFFVYTSYSTLICGTRHPTLGLDLASYTLLTMATVFVSYMALMRAERATEAA